MLPAHSLSAHVERDQLVVGRCHGRKPARRGNSAEPSAAGAVAARAVPSGSASLRSAPGTSSASLLAGASVIGACASWSREACSPAAAFAVARRAAERSNGEQQRRCPGAGRGRGVSSASGAARCRGSDVLYPAATISLHDAASQPCVCQFEHEIREAQKRSKQGRAAGGGKSARRPSASTAGFRAWAAGAQEQN